MEAKDLMVGDLFKVNKDVCIKKGTIVMVTAIDDRDSLINFNLKGSTHCVNINDEYDNGGVWAAYLDPIPLTIEILEKNGFEYDDNGKDLRYRQSCGDIIGIDIRGDIGYLEDADLDYVHQLQHALRLCGIEKEIILY